MSIEVISLWYNEELLAPLFLKNYQWADKITIYYDNDSDDKTLEYLKASPLSIQIIPFRFPDMMDEEIKADIFNKAYKNSVCDYVLNVDCDEFAFYTRQSPEGGGYL